MRPRRTQRLRLLAPAWYEARYGIPRDEAEAHYVKEGHVLGLAPTPLFDVAWYRDRYGPTPGPPLAELERHAWEQAPNRWLDPSTLRAAGIAERDVLGQLAAARIRLDDPRTLAPTASAVARVWRGDRVARDGAEVVVLAHYDAPGVMSPAFLDLVGAFAAADRDVVVCSTSVAAAGEGLDAVLPLTHAVCAVPNTGHDWGAYQAGLRFVLDELAPRSVVLANDSVYVVPDRLGPFLDRLGALDADLAGATDSDELVPHLQSYLLRLSAAALSGPLVEELLTTYVPLAEKELVIHSYELGFCRRAREHGMELGAVHPLRELAESALREGTATESVLRRIDSGIPVTPPLHLWRPLLQDGFPFLKRQLLRDEMAPRELLAELVPEQVLALAEEDIAARRARGL
jgi:hypothetical protein